MHAALPIQSRTSFARQRVYRRPWTASATLHALLAGGLVWLVFFSSPATRKATLDIRVIEVPKATTAPALKPITPEAPPKPKTKIHEVFGASRKSMTSSAADALSVKTGNTVTKAPDQEVLKPGDPDRLPIPVEEYLVTRMPTLISDVHVPYPPGPKGRGIQGKVVMDMLIDENGKVRDVKLIEAPDPELGAAALAAAHGFEFKPALIQEKTVAVRIHYAYRFVLEH
jgi:TonB family protein